MLNGLRTNLVTTLYVLTVCAGGGGGGSQVVHLFRRNSFPRHTHPLVNGPSHTVELFFVITFRTSMTSP